MQPAWQPMLIPVNVVVRIESSSSLFGHLVHDVVVEVPSGAEVQEALALEDDDDLPGGNPLES